MEDVGLGRVNQLARLDDRLSHYLCLGLRCHAAILVVISVDFVVISVDFPSRRDHSILDCSTYCHCSGAEKFTLSGVDHCEKGDRSKLQLRLEVSSPVLKQLERESMENVSGLVRRKVRVLTDFSSSAFRDARKVTAVSPEQFKFFDLVMQWEKWPRS
jgi:hypothetical protein